MLIFAAASGPAGMHIYILYIYIYIYAVKLLSGPSLGVFGCYYLVQVEFLDVIIWSKFVFLANKNSGFKRFVLHTQLSFCVFFCAQFSGNFLKIAFFKKRVQKLGFSIFCVLSQFFEFFLGLLKHYKNRGFSRFLCFLFLKDKKEAEKLITGIYKFGFFWSKNGRFVTHICFPKKKALEPLFL